jgi:hypothetical protein
MPRASTQQTEGDVVTETIVALPPAYHGSEEEKRATLVQLRHHRELDQIVQGTYWEGNGDGRGCAVGCLTHDPDGGHKEFPERWGIPVQIAWIIDTIFESLPVDEAKDWPATIMSAIPVGADLSRSWDRFAAWMLRDLLPVAGVNTPVVEVMVTLFDRAASGDEPSSTEWSEAAWAAEAAEAARAAEAAWAARAARAARAAEAAWAARAAWAAEAAEAAWAAWATRAAWAAEAAWAAWATRAAWAAARNDWARRASAELVRIVETSAA